MYLHRRFFGGLSTRQSNVSGFVHDPIDIVLDLLQLILIEHSFVDEQCAKTLHRIALGIAGAFLVRAIELFIV